MSSRHLFKLLPVVLALVLPAANAQAPIADESAAIAEAAQRVMASGKPMFVSADKRGLQYGMMGWTADDAMLGSFKRFPSDMQRDFPITGSAAK